MILKCLYACQISLNYLICVGCFRLRYSTYSKIRHEGLYFLGFVFFFLVSALWNTNEILLIYKMIVGIKFLKWL